MMVEMGLVRTRQRKGTGRVTRALRCFLLFKGARLSISCVSFTPSSKGWKLLGSLFLFCFLTAAAEVAVAQVASRELLLFMEVPTVVTAARREQPLTKASATTKVITAQEIRRSGAHTIPEILRYVAGLDVSRAVMTLLSHCGC